MRAYCHTCQKNVETLTTKCPSCTKVLWDIVATKPENYQHATRSTAETYRQGLDAVDRQAGQVKRDEK